MSRTIGRCGRILGVGLAAVFLSLNVAAAQSPSADVSTPFREALGSGEFSTAVVIADSLDGPARDAALVEIAAVQARSGAAAAAAATTAAMRDDRLRSRSLDLLGYGGANVVNEVPAGRVGAPGGGVQPDFESLIDLITSTIRQQDWADNGGTIGAISSHDGGVFVDASGTVKPIVHAKESARLGALRRAAAQASTPGGARATSTLRKVSLTRLDRELQLRKALNRPLDEEMRTLAGLQRITHVFVYPESGDVVVAGPAGDWYLGRESRFLSVADDRPVVLLDDLITLVEREFRTGGVFGCSIEPTTDGLQRVQKFVDGSKGRALDSSGLTRWTTQLRDALGRQDVRVYGVDPQSRVARTLVEADYRMKLVGIEREEGTINVPSYFKIVKASGREPPSMGLLRWWFTVNYESLLASADRNVYELRGQGVRLSSEDEFLSAQGRRVSTGQADDRNREYSDNFTKHFAEIAQKYPIYADLRNIFDLAVVAAVLKNEAVCDRVGWNRLGFAAAADLATNRGFSPMSVESVANSALLSKSRVMAVISGGVTVDVSQVADRAAIQIDDRGRLAKERQSAAPGKLSTHAWWWD